MTDTRHPAPKPSSSQTSGAVQPFAAGHWFPIHNAVFDVIMPQLSGSAWKILSVAIRQTWGWVADPSGNPKIRREWDHISYSQFLEKSGIKSRATVSKALKECRRKGYLLRRQIGIERGQPIYAYALNRDFEAKSPTGSENEPVTGTDTEPVTGSKNEPTKQIETDEQNSDDGLTKRQMVSHALLTDFGVSEPIATRIAYERNPSDVIGWLEYARKARGLNNPTGLVVRRLLDGVPAPSENGSGSIDARISDSAARKKTYASNPLVQI